MPAKRNIFGLLRWPAKPQSGRRQTLDILFLTCLVAQVCLLYARGSWVIAKTPSPTMKELTEAWHKDYDYPYLQPPETTDGQLTKRYPSIKTWRCFIRESIVRNSSIKFWGPALNVTIQRKRAHGLTCWPIITTNYFLISRFPKTATWCGKFPMPKIGKSLLMAGKKLKKK